MVAKNDVVSAAEKIDAALQQFVHNRSEAKVSVSADNWGKLLAVVVTHAFAGMPADERKRLVWEFLRQQVDANDLAHLFRVYAFTGDEYDGRISPGVPGSGNGPTVQLEP